MISELENIRRHLKRDYELELQIGIDGKVEHDECIDHCLPYAFGVCKQIHNKRCVNCYNFHKFFENLQNSLGSDHYEFLENCQQRLYYYLAHQTRKVYLNAQLKANLLELDNDGALLIVDYKMRILPKTARETKAEFFGKRGWTLHSVLLYTKNEEETNLNITAFDHWSLDTKQDAWFTASSLHAVFNTMPNNPKWITIFSDNGPHYHNSEMMAIMTHWKEWYDVTIKRWIFLEAGEAKTAIDSHHAQVKSNFF